MPASSGLRRESAPEAPGARLTGREPPARTPQSWSRIAERGSLWGMRFTVACYRWLGRRASVVLVHGIVAYFFLTDGRGRRASRAFLRRVWEHPRGRRALGREPGLWDSFLQYREFGLAIVDRLAIWSGRTADIEFEVHGMDHFDRLAEQGRGGLVIGAHLGNFDAMRLLAERAQTVVNVLMFTEHAQRINRIFRELSPQSEARVIHVDPGSVQSVFEIRECVRRGELVAILGDRVEAAERGRTGRATLLGGPIQLPQAPFLLAHLLRCPVFLMVALRRGPARYEVFAERLAEQVRLPRRGRQERIEELLTAYASRLEHYCLGAPHQWFNFFDYWADPAPR